MDDHVFLAKCQTYEKDEVSLAVSRCLDFYGGAKALLSGKTKVLLKPNLLLARSPDGVTTTHPEIVSALAREFIGAGAQVTIADSPGGPYTPPLLATVYRVCGMEKAAEETGALLNYDLSVREMSYPGGETVKKFPVIKPAADAEFIVDCSKIKTHGMTYYSGAVKNMFGVIPGLTKPVFHARFPNASNFCNMLVDLCELVRPDFSIADGVYGMEGNGPSGGSAKKIGMLAASLNPHALDLACMNIVSLDHEKSDIYKNAARRLLVVKSPELLNYSGDSPDMFKTGFVPSMAGKKGAGIRFLPKFMQPLLMKLFVPYPKINIQKCIGCAKCAESCPQQIIEIRDKKARINYKGCIKCYCCHEMCPVLAIDL